VQIKDKTGQTFVRLRVESRTSGPNPKETYYRCVCDCGTIVVVTGRNLRSGNSKSCGCLSREKSSRRWRKHGASKVLPEYAVWTQIKTRCYSRTRPSYRHYGGRGITMCDAWQADFSAFYTDMGPRPSAKHSIDRINNDGPYGPYNCRWATKREQGRNQRTNVGVGPYPTITAAAEAVGIKPGTLWARLNAGWSVERALTE
jgi:hypothetical protein